LANIMESGDNFDAMVQEALYIMKHLKNYDKGFMPRTVMMNLYGTQQWFNAHFHMFAGERTESNYWTILDSFNDRVFDHSLARHKINEYSFFPVTGTRGSPLGLIESAYAVEINGHSKGLFNEVTSLTELFQINLTPEQRRSPFPLGFDGYGTLVFKPSGSAHDNWDSPHVFYIIRPH